MKPRTKNVVLGGTLAGLGAAATSLGMDLLDEGIAGPTGLEYAYYIAIRQWPQTNQSHHYRKRPGKTTRTAYSAAAGRAYQFWPAGLQPVINPTPIEKAVIGRRAAMSVTTSIITRSYDCDSKEFYGKSLHDEPMGFYVLNGPTLVDTMAQYARVRRNFPVREIDLNKRRIYFDNHRGFYFDYILSSMPLEAMSRLCLPGSQTFNHSVGLQVLNIGFRIDEYPVAREVHKLDIVAADQYGRVIDSIDFYSHISPTYFCPTYDGEKRLSLAVKHYVEPGIEPIEVNAFKRQVIKELRDLGLWQFDSYVEAFEYHYLPFYKVEESYVGWAYEMQHFLAGRGIYCVGGAARGIVQDPARDLLEGFAAGSTLI